MAVQWLLVCHGLVTLLVVVSFLCGQWPIFQGTFIQRIHTFLTFGAFDYFRRFIEFVFGSRGTNALYLTQYYCCDRPNPILQAALLSGGVNASHPGLPGAASSAHAGIAAFEMEYEQWVEEQNKKTNALKTALNAPLPDIEIDILVKDTLNHYANLFNIKATAAKIDVCYLISGMWKTSTERLFLWIGGFRPSELLKVLVPQLELLDQQSHDLGNLIQACQQAEDSLSQVMEKLQQTLAEAVACARDLGGDCYEMSNPMEKLEELVRLVIQADYVRHETLQQTLRYLTTRQAAQGLISLGLYFQRLRELSSVWTKRVSEVA